MKLKNLACAALAGALALSLSAPAFAAEDLAVATEYEGSMNVPTINITVPESGTVVLNPYKLSYGTAPNDSTDQIISATNHITNASDVALNVSATVTGVLPTGKKDVTFATATTQNASKPLTTNAIFMYFEIGAVEAATDEADWPEAGYVAKPAADQAVKQILVANKATTVNNLLTLESGKTTPTYAAYRLTGDIVSAPTRAWAEDDSVSATVAFTFTPTASATTD